MARIYDTGLNSSLFHMKNFMSALFLRPLHKYPEGVSLTAVFKFDSG